MGARLAEALLRRLRFPRSVAEGVAHLVRHHMFGADPALSDAAVRRFLKRIGARNLDSLFALRRADDIGSGLPPDDPATSSRSARAWTRSSRRRPRSTGTPSPSTATT